MVSIFVILWVIIILVRLSVLFNLWMSLISMFIEIGFCLVNGLLYIMRFGFSVIDLVNVVWCVILFDSLLGINWVVFCSFIVCNFNDIIVVIIDFDSLVCFCNGNVILLNIDILVNNVLFWNNMFIWWWVWYNLWCDIFIIELLLNVILLLLGCNCLLINFNSVVLLILLGFIIVVILFFGICNDILL